MKTNFLSVVLLAGLALASNVQAQPAHVFGSLTVIEVAKPFVASGAASLLTTNAPVDTHGCEGTGLIILNVVTNAGGLTLSCTLEGSSDQTNWTAISYAIASTNSLIYTNFAYSNYATNKTFLPGTLTTPTAATSGFATPYLAPLQYTNSGAFTCSGSSTYVLGYVVDAAPRYLHTIWNPSAGAVTNYTAGAQLIVRKQNIP